MASRAPWGVRGLGGGLGTSESLSLSPAYPAVLAGFPTMQAASVGSRDKGSSLIVGPWVSPSLPSASIFSPVKWTRVGVWPALPAPKF